AVTAIVEGTPPYPADYFRAHFAVEQLSFGSTSWWVEQLIDSETRLRRAVFEIPRRKPAGPPAPFERHRIAGTIIGPAWKVLRARDSTPLSAMPPELLADSLTSLSRGMTGDWVRHWCAVAQHSGSPIRTAVAEVTDSATFVRLHSDAGDSILLGSTGSPNL